MGFSEKLKALRKQKGLTQAQFAKDFDIATGTIGMWESGKREPNFETMCKIADYFFVTVDYLLDRDPQESDDEMTQLLQDIKDDPDKRMLFSLSQKASPEDVKVMVKFLEGITKSDNDE